MEYADEGSSGPTPALNPINRIPPIVTISPTTMARMIRILMTNRLLRPKRAPCQFGVLLARYVRRREISMNNSVVSLRSRDLTPGTLPRLPPRSKQRRNRSTKNAGVPRRIRASVPGKATPRTRRLKQATQSMGLGRFRAISAVSGLTPYLKEVQSACDASSRCQFINISLKN